MKIPKVVFSMIQTCILSCGALTCHATEPSPTSTPPIKANSAIDPARLDDLTARAIKVIGLLEGEDPWAKITGNFDGTGLSCGVLGFTFIHGEQQRHVVRFLTENGTGALKRCMPDTWEEYEKLCRMATSDAGIAASFDAVKKWSVIKQGPGSTRSTVVREPFKSQLFAFWSSPEMQKFQLVLLKKTGEEVAALCTAWRSDWDVKDFLFFYDRKTLHEYSLERLNWHKQLCDAFMAAGDVVIWQAIRAWGDHLPKMVYAASLDTVVNVDGIKAFKINMEHWPAKYAAATLAQKRLLVMGFISATYSATSQLRVVSMNRGALLAVGAGIAYDDDVSRDITSYWKP